MGIPAVVVLREVKITPTARCFGDHFLTFGAQTFRWITVFPKVRTGLVQQVRKIARGKPDPQRALLLLDPKKQ